MSLSDKNQSKFRERYLSEAFIKEEQKFLFQLLPLIPSLAEMHNDSTFNPVGKVVDALWLWVLSTRYLCWPIWYLASLLITDDGDCQTLQLLWDPDNRQGGYCSKTDTESCAAGEMTEKHGKIRVGARQSIFSRKIYKDASLPPIPFGGRRKIFVVIFHPDKPDTIVGCARVQKVFFRELKLSFHAIFVCGISSKN